MTKRGAERVWPEPKGENSGFSYKLKVVEGGYAIRIERGGHGQTIRHDKLCIHGMNAVTGAMRLIDMKVEGIVE